MPSSPFERWQDRDWQNEPLYTSSIDELLATAFHRLAAGTLWRQEMWERLRQAELKSMSLRQRFYVTYFRGAIEGAFNASLDAINSLNRAYELAEALDERLYRATTLQLRGNLFRHLSYFRTAASDYAQCLALLLDQPLNRQQADAPLVFAVHAQLAVYEFFAADPDAALRHLQAADELSATAKISPLDIAAIFWTRALLARSLRHPEQALTLANEAAGVYAERGHPASAARIQTVVAESALDLAVRYQGAPDQRAYLSIAHTHIALALQFAKEGQDAGGTGLAMLSQTRLERLQGRLTDRVQTLEDVIRQTQVTDDPALEAEALFTLGSEWESRGEHEAARACYRQSLDALTQVEAPMLALPARRALHLLDEFFPTDPPGS